MTIKNNKLQSYNIDVPISAFAQEISAKKEWLDELLFNIKDMLETENNTEALTLSQTQLKEAYSKLADLANEVYLLNLSVIGKISYLQKDTSRK